jgi:hypothetical protein
MRERSLGMEEIITRGEQRYGSRETHVDHRKLETEKR